MLGFVLAAGRGPGGLLRVAEALGDGGGVGPGGEAAGAGRGGYGNGN